MSTKKKFILYLLLLSTGFAAQACQDDALVPLKLADATLMLSQEVLNTIPGLRGIQNFNPSCSVFNDLNSDTIITILDILQSENKTELFEKLKTLSWSINPTNNLNNLWNLVEIVEYLQIELFGQKLSTNILKYLTLILINHYCEEDALQWLMEKEQTLFFNTTLGLTLKTELATYYFNEPIKIKETTLTSYLQEKDCLKKPFTEKRKLFISSVDANSVVVSDDLSLNKVNEIDYTYEEIFTLTRNTTNHLSPIKKASLSSNHHFLITQSDDALVVTQIAENKQVIRIPSACTPHNFPNKIDISADNNHLISYSHDKVNITDLTSQETNIFHEVKKINDKSNSIAQAYLSRDTQFLITVTNENITITHLKTKKLFKVLSHFAIVSTTLKTISFINEGNLELYLTDTSSIIADQCTAIDIYKAIKAQKNNPLDRRITIDNLNDSLFAYYTDPVTPFEKSIFIMEKATQEEQDTFIELQQEPTTAFEFLLTHLSALGNTHTHQPKEKIEKLYSCLAYCLKNTLIKATKILLEDTTNTDNPFSLELTHGIDQLTTEGELL